MRIAFTREVSLRIAECELTHLQRDPVNASRAREQHAVYENRLREAGCDVRRLPPLPDCPDSVFVEDTAVVLDEIAVITRPGAASRRPETGSTAQALRAFRELVTVTAPGILDGGDVLRVGKNLYVGLSGRTNPAGLDALAKAVGPHGYTARGVELSGCLHLKSAVTRVAEDTVLLNPAWVEPAVFSAFAQVAVDPAEPAGGNALQLGDTLIFPEEFPRTRERLEAAGIPVTPVPAGELAKAEGGVTCCSLIIDA